jgi:hypothetical protein
MGAKLVHRVALSFNYDNADRVGHSAWLFPGYCFVRVELQWHAGPAGARRCPPRVEWVGAGEDSCECDRRSQVA